MSHSTKILMVVPVPPWPTVTGGRFRASRIAQELSSRFDTLVTYPVRGEHISPDHVQVAPLYGWSPPNRFRKISRWITLRAATDNTVTWSTKARDMLAAVADEFAPDYVFWFGSPTYVGSVATGARHIVSFEDIEELRQRSFSRTGSRRSRVKGFVEHIAAKRWERSLARKAALTVALSEADKRILERRSSHTMLAPNGIDLRPYVASPDRPIILAVAAWEYRPNRDGILRFLRADWPRIRALFPDCELHIVGRGGEALAGEAYTRPAEEGLVCHGYVEDLDELFAQCSLALAPAESGGGSQLKLFDAIARGRVTVGPSYLGRELNDDMRHFIIASNDLAAVVDNLLSSPNERHRRERAALAYGRSHTWSEELSGLVTWILQDSAALIDRDAADGTSSPNLKPERLRRRTNSDSHLDDPSIRLEE